MRPPQTPDPWGPPGPAGSPGPNGLAVTALVVAVANVVFGSFLGFFVPLVPAFAAVVAVVLGHVALRQIDRGAGQGRALAVAALVIGYLCLAGVALVVALAMTFATVGMALLGF
jgi:hypothetical protein